MRVLIIKRSYFQLCLIFTMESLPNELLEMIFDRAVYSRDDYGETFWNHTYTVIKFVCWRWHDVSRNLVPDYEGAGAMSDAIDKGEMNVIEWLWSREYTFDDLDVQIAVGDGNLEFLKWMHKEGLIAEVGDIYGTISWGRILIWATVVSLDGEKYRLIQEFVQRNRQIK